MSIVGGIPEQVMGLRGIRLVKPNEPNEIADAIDWDLSMDRHAADELSLKNREDILRKFNNCKSVSELINVVEKVKRLR